ncbi:MAG: Eco57I restriction-modification methylase domain-containing protein [Pirellulales bacterium]|nr:Eco57I restriction-modification methylase domain-containing protein [Pirellulales bacterium]
MTDLLSRTAQIQSEYYGKTTCAYRKEKGQVFTPPEIARFMASLLSEIPRELRLLDAGAGVGSLTVAICERVARLQSPCELHVVLFESEPQLVSLLRENLDYCKSRLAERGHVLEFTIRDDDFILAAASQLDGQNRLFVPSFENDFDAVIMNPPYFKVRRDSEHAKMLERIVHGQPNAYAFFMALAAALLRPNGELIAITPRSFCGGLYFRGFRKWFFDKMCLDHIHLFASRTDAFKDSEVLQESVITKSHRLGKQTTSVHITESFGRRIAQRPNMIVLGYKNVLDTTRGEYLVKIPVSKEDCAIMRFVESLPHRFDEIGLRISTGPVVTFRAKDLILLQPNGQATVPLLMPHNVKAFRTQWPVERKKHPVYVIDCEVSRQRRLLIPTRNYVLLKRFTSKEEGRRLTAACLLRSEQKTKRIGLENHLNYIYHADRELTLDETFGIAAIFNSVIVDRYFRVLSGNTQVNATEIRNLHFPSLEDLATLGTKVRSIPNWAPAETEAAVLDILGVGQSFIEHLVAVA